MNTLSLAGPRGLDRMPAWGWLAMQAAALWPHLRWAAARVTDGSDDPLGLAALGLLAVLLWRLAPRMEDTPRPAWLALGTAGTLLATVALWWLPPLAAALLAALAFAAALAAWLPVGVARLPVAGLALLALPLLASLQFYAGYPLRLVTAQLSTWLLQMVGLVAERSGAAMTVQGRLVIVDAPCSGVQMAWLGYFVAFGVAAWIGLRDRTLLRRLPGVGALVIAGNVLRNALLVALESRPGGLSEIWHQAIGLVVLAAVCIAVLGWTARADHAHDD